MSHIEHHCNFSILDNNMICRMNLVKCVSLEIIHVHLSIINYTPRGLSTEVISFTCPNTSTVLVFIITIIIIIIII